MAFLLLSVPGSTGRFGAFAEQPPDAPLPEISAKELAGKIREARKSYDDVGLFEVAFDEVRDTNPNFELNQGNAEEQRPILVVFHGLVRFASNGLQWRAEYDSMMPNALSTQLAA